MKHFLMILSIFFIMQNANALLCADLGEPNEILTGRFVPISRATRKERQIAAKLAADAASIFRPTNPFFGF